MSQKTNENPPDLWLQYMLKGDFEQVWKLSDAGLKSRAGKPEWHLPRHLQHIWDGSSLGGKRVLVRCYHGLGDTIQFIRYVPLVKSLAREVIVWAQQELIPLLESLQDIDVLLPLHNGSPEVEFDVDVEIMELPHIFRTTLSEIPSDLPYLHVAPKQDLPDNGFLNVGLVWKAGDWDSRRSIPFAELWPLFDIPGVNFYILQADPRGAGWQEGLGIYPGPLDLGNYAGFMKGLDLVISVDSMPVHLAGALGVPVWNLLFKEADWRWMSDRDDSPWYPTMRLFRQKDSGDWSPVIGQVSSLLIEQAHKPEVRRIR
jgi:hypothetical protein